MDKLKTALITSSLLASTQLNAAIIEYDIELDVSNSTNSTSTQWRTGNVSLTPGDINYGDTVRITVDFANEDKIQMTDLSTGVGNSLWFAINSSTAPFGSFDIDGDYEITLSDVSGSPLNTSVSDTNTYIGWGDANISASPLFDWTDSSLEFGGFTAEFTINSTPSQSGQQPLSTPFDNFEFAIFNYEYDVIPGTSPVPVPAAVWLFASGLLGLVGVGRRKA